MNGQSEQDEKRRMPRREPEVMRYESPLVSLACERKGYEVVNAVSLREGQQVLFPNDPEPFTVTKVDLQSSEGSATIDEVRIDFENVDSNDIKCRRFWLFNLDDKVLVRRGEVALEVLAIEKRIRDTLGRFSKKLPDYSNRDEAILALCDLVDGLVVELEKQLLVKMQREQLTRSFETAGKTLKQLCEELDRIQRDLAADQETKEA